MILFFEPVFLETMWAGNRLNQLYHQESNTPIGECLGISTLDKGVSIVKNGVYKGMKLTTLWQDHRELFGYYPMDNFPILIKLIDAFDDLSIQVHPDHLHLTKEEFLPKNEYLYIIDCDPFTDIIIGHNAKNKSEFMHYIEKGDYHHLIRQVPIKKGDSFFIEAGTLHAICKGTFLLEVEHSSDVSYRFYDYDRQYHGEKRVLNVRKAMNSVKIPDQNITNEIKYSKFDVEIININSSIKIENKQFGIFFGILEGSIQLNDTSSTAGDFGFISVLEQDIVCHGYGTIAIIHLKI